jgi:hypothetical protein
MVPLGGSAVAALAIYGSYNPFPQGIYLYINFGFLTYAIAGVLVAVWLRRRHPAMLGVLGHDMDVEAAVVAEEVR